MNQDIREVIRKRRSVFPAAYLSKPIPHDVIVSVLEAANWAPNHKKTQPWRFVVFESAESRQDLSDYLASAYKASVSAEKFSEIQQKKISEKPLQSACVIAICMQRSGEDVIPEWEEIAAVACAVQNMWLSCTAEGIGSFWATPGLILKADAYLGLQEGQRCLGLFYMGYSDQMDVPGQRDDIETKISWR
jgi:nitroreductase